MAKSNLKVLQKGEILFNQGESAAHLYIIQEGKIRLYKPKGQNDVELAVVGKGEVLGEMAYFDSNPTARSCSGMALEKSKIIEISFEAFGKTIKTVEPWLKTIILTLVQRLKKTNMKVMSLDQSSARLGGTGVKLSDYEISKILCSLYLCFKAHGDQQNQLITARKLFKFYISDVHGLSEAKLELALDKLKKIKLIKEHKESQSLLLEDIESLKSMFLYFQEKVKTTVKEELLSLQSIRILDEVFVVAKSIEGKTYVDVYELLAQAKKKNTMKLEFSDLDDPTKMGYISDAVMIENKEHVIVYEQKLRSGLFLNKFLYLLKD